jgi:hypothetical protein
MKASLLRGPRKGAGSSQQSPVQPRRSISASELSVTRQAPSRQDLGADRNQARFCAHSQSHTPAAIMGTHNH